MTSYLRLLRSRKGIPDAVESSFATFVEQRWRKAVALINLQDQRVRLRYERAPGTLASELEARPEKRLVVCVDEIQKVPEGHERVFRGGSWSHRARECRSPYRNWVEPGRRGYVLGFRLASGQ